MKGSYINIEYRLQNFEMRKTKSRRSVPVDISFSFIDSCVEIFMECFVLLGWLISFVAYSHFSWIWLLVGQYMKNVLWVCFELICCWFFFSLWHLNYLNNVNKVDRHLSESWEIVGVLSIGRWYNLFGKMSHN